MPKKFKGRWILTADPLTWACAGGPADQARVRVYRLDFGDFTAYRSQVVHQGACNSDVHVMYLWAEGVKPLKLPCDVCFKEVATRDTLSLTHVDVLPRVLCKGCWKDQPTFWTLSGGHVSRKTRVSREVFTADNRLVREIMGRG